MYKETYLFFCQHCGVPREIPTEAIKNYLISSYVPGYYCLNNNCRGHNTLTSFDKRELIERVYGS